MKKKLFGIALLVSMLAMLFSVSAFAEETFTECSTWAAIQTAFDNGQSVKLTADVTASAEDSALSVGPYNSSNVTYTLDLNGHTLSRGLSAASPVAAGYVIKTTLVSRKAGNLIVTDSSDNQNGKITGGNCSESAGAVYVNESTKFTLEAGEISGNYGKTGGAIYSNGGTVIINGGKITENRANIAGAINAVGSVTINGGYITNNTATNKVPGINARGIVMTGGEISGNTGGTIPAAVNLDATRSYTATISGGKIYNNDAGVCANVSTSSSYTATLNISGSVEIRDNTQYNLYLPSGVNTNITGEMSGIIGITSQAVPESGSPVTIAVPADGVTADASRFTSDNAELYILKDSTGNIILSADNTEEDLSWSLLTDISSAEDIGDYNAESEIKYMTKNESGEKIEETGALKQGAKKVCVFAKNPTGAVLAAQSYGVVIGKAYYPGLAEIASDEYFSIMLIDMDGTILSDDNYSAVLKYNGNEVSTATVQTETVTAE